MHGDEESSMGTREPETGDATCKRHGIVAMLLLNAPVVPLRCITISPTMPYILTSSDDMLIKLWDWEKVGGSVRMQAHL